MTHSTTGAPVRKKLAFIAAFPPPISGQSLAAKLLADGLEKSGVFCLSYFDISAPIAGSPLPSRIAKLFRVAANLAFFCLQNGDGVVYLQLGHGKKALLRDLIFMSIAMATHHPYVGHVHGSGLRVALDSLPKPIRTLERIALQRLSAAIVLCPSLCSMFDGIAPPNRIFHVDNGIDANFVHLAQQAVRPRSTHDSLRILFLSNFIAAKGVFYLLEAAQIAQKCGKNYRFVLVGAQQKDNPVADFARRNKLKNVEIHGIATGMDKHRHYADADVFILPSEYEGQPLCILEALFEGLPIVTSPVGGIPDIFRDDESCVRLIAPHKPQDFLDAIASLESPNVRIQIAQNARKLAFSRFTAEKHIETMENILLSIENPPR